MTNKIDTQKRVFLRTFGCQMNVRDSEVIAGLLKNNGYKLVAEPDKADIILLNTCSVRQHAEDKVWSELSRYKQKIIGVIGCMAQSYKEDIFRKAPNVSFVVGPNDIHKIPEIINKVSDTEHLFSRKIWETEGSTRPDDIYHTGFYEDKNHAYVVISEGCSNHCSYCVVPYVRGGLRNRNHKDILKEIKEAVDKGIDKITLLGQNVNAYQTNGINFIKLIESVNAVRGLKEFGFITSHPKDTSVGLFEAIRDLDKLKKYLHLPVQSGSDIILKLMNRGYTRKFYLDLADNFRKAVKDGVLTTDIIVGFPTETEADFEATCNLVKDTQFDAAYIFKYSPRPYTQAANMPDDVVTGEKKRRHRIILELQKEISRSKE